ncbi:helix-turn-helix transcriptional regulator [Paenibacillus aestuarii]|uniref:AraC family transcriptional regulator n=1 Tax=Paenibacillus aestuarii TaxID=516965 RepID=A0ABW0K9Y4_9BACL|nr:AraC family transcriptional regulator [Paenibacillus aestuarii]
MSTKELTNPYWQADDIQLIEIHLFTPSAFEQANAIWPIRLGRNHTKPNYHVGPRTTTYYSLHFVLDGTGLFFHEGQSYILNRGDLFCLFPQLTHEYYTSADWPLKLAWIAFDGKLALDVLDKIGLRPSYPFLAHAFDMEIEKSLEAFFHLVRKGETPGSDLLKSSEFLGIIGELIERADQPGYKDQGSESWLEKGISYMNMHFAEGITVNEISKYVGVDRTHFSKSFRKSFGVTPVQYLQQLKMKTAKSMLTETENNLAEIAQSIGYPDVFTFSKAFKKLVGMPPNHYRHQK